MTYTRTWDAANEAAPGATDLVSGGDDAIRNLKTDIRERIAKDHYMDIAGTDADHGEHQKITFQSQIAKPAAVANKGFLYIKDVSAKAELHWEDEDGHELALTSAGAVVAGSCTGNAATATKLATPRTINGTNFDGSANIAVVPRVLAEASTATPSINVDAYDAYSLTALAAAITSVTITGTPNNFQRLLVRIKDNGTARAIAWGTTYFGSHAVVPPASTTASKILTVVFLYDSVAGKWSCVGVTESY
jgi:hypothetical protein